MLWRPPSESKRMYFQTMIMQFEGGPKRCIKRCRPQRPRKYQNQTEATGRENTPPGLSLIVQMKRGKQNLRRVYFYPTALCCIFVVF